jgi:DNA-directed RNA polymerase specialized sigma24 family protein
METTDRTEKLLALILLNQIKTQPKREQAVTLSVAGFTNSEIADLLGTSAAVIAQSLYEARQKPSRRPKRSKAK